MTVVPLRLGPRPVGLLVTGATKLDVGTLDALGGVVAIAIERAQLLDERKRADALSQRHLRCCPRSATTCGPR